MTRDRSREPIDITDLGISTLSGQWSPQQNSTRNHSDAIELDPTQAAIIASSMPELTTSMSEDVASPPQIMTPSELPTPDVSEITSAMSHVEIDETDRAKAPETQSKRVKGVRFEGIQDTLPRSRSYSERSERSRRNRNSKRKNCSSHSVPNKHSGSSRSRRRGHDDPDRDTNTREKGGEHDSDDASSVCSTCSSSSSSTDDFAYQLPQRRHYGGVRVSYVPNDALACARQRKQQVDTEKDNKNCIIS